MASEILARLAQAAALAIALTVLLMAYLSGLDAGVAGVPGEESCTRCHSGTGGPGATGSVTVTFPGAHTFTPGVKQHLVVTIADSGARRWGFQLTRKPGETIILWGTSFGATIPALRCLTHRKTLTPGVGRCNSSQESKHVHFTLKALAIAAMPRKSLSG